MRWWRRFAGGTLLAASLCAVGPVPSSQAATSRPTPSTVRPELLGDAEQVVIVSASQWDTTVASVSMYQKVSGTWRRVAGPYGARVGRNGLSTTHLEGDGTTPAGSYPILSAFGWYASARTKLPYTRVRSGSCWISDVTRVDYNTMVVEPSCSSPNENLYRIARSGPYRRAIVTGYNIAPTVPGDGSAIFLHSHAYSRGRTKATSGCVSLSSRNLYSHWRRLDPAKHPRVIIGPTSWLNP